MYDINTFLALFEAVFFFLQKSLQDIKHHKYQFQSGVRVYLQNARLLASYMPHSKIYFNLQVLISIHVEYVRHY